MSRRFIRLLLSAFVLCAATVACVPQQTTRPQPAATSRPAAQRLTPQQRAAAIKKQNQVLVQYARRIARMIGQGQNGQVWDQASPVAKQSVSRTRFIRGTRSTRERLGKVTQRRLVRITRTVSKGQGRLPAGRYVNVNFATKFTNIRQAVRETVSFHLDRDRRWRLAGYDVR